MSTFSHILLLCSNMFRLSAGCHTDSKISIQGVPGGKLNILGGQSIGHSKQKCLYEHVSYSERFPR